MDFRANDEAERFARATVGQQKQCIGMHWAGDPLRDQARTNEK